MTWNADYAYNPIMESYDRSIMGRNHEIKLGDMWSTSINGTRGLVVVIVGINYDRKLVDAWPIIESDVIKPPGVKAITASGGTVQVVPSFSFSFNESLLDHPLGKSISADELIEIHRKTGTLDKQDETWNDEFLKNLTDSITDLAENEIGEPIGSLPFDAGKLRNHGVTPSDIIKYVEDNDDGVISMDRAKGLLEGRLVPTYVEAYDVAEGVSKTEENVGEVSLLQNEVEAFLNRGCRKIVDRLSDPIWKNDVQSVMRSMSTNEAAARTAIMEGVLSNGGPLNADNQQVNKMIVESVASLSK